MKKNTDNYMSQTISRVEPRSSSTTQISLSQSHHKHTPFLSTVSDADFPDAFTEERFHSKLVKNFSVWEEA